MKQLSFTFNVKVKPAPMAAPARSKDSAPFVQGRKSPAKIKRCVYCKTIHAEKKFCPMCGEAVN